MVARTCGPETINLKISQAKFMFGKSNTVQLQTGRERERERERLERCREREREREREKERGREREREREREEETEKCLRESYEALGSLVKPSRSLGLVCWFVYTFCLQMGTEVSIFHSHC